MDSVEDYARRWAKQEEVELDSMSEWIKSIRHLLKRRMYMAGRSINNKPKSVFSETDVTEHLADLHNRYVIVTADKASNNVVFVGKTYYLECLQRELDLDDCYVPLCPPFRYVRMRTQRNAWYVPLCPPFRYVRDGFSSFRCIRVRT